MKNKLKIALASPEIKLCVPDYNARICAECARSADASGADIIVFPELTLTGATAGDLYFQELLLDAAEDALASYIELTTELSVMSFIGLPVRVDGAVYNAVACVSEGEIIGITASGEQSRHFTPSPKNTVKVSFAGQEAELGRNLIYNDESTGADIFVKVGTDNAFSTDGVDLIVNPIAEPEFVGLKAKRELYSKEVSLGLGVAFAMVGAGIGESGTDGIYASARLVAHRGFLLASSALFDSEILYSELDLKNKKKCDSIGTLADKVTRFPFIPDNDDERREACSLALEIQSRSLAKRMERAYGKCAVIGVSGGLDSTLALLVSARAMDILGRDRSGVIAITMPCFGTTERTKNNALVLAEELGCTVRTIDIKAAVNQHFADISHDAESYDVVYENAQARERTQILMDIANAESGLVIGTGDLSELALGFATYNGDHMSMYCVNGSVPKTFMREIIRYAAECEAEGGRAKLSEALLDVINTPVSPELLPTKDGECEQHTESIVGPYELHDFFLYYLVKYGYSPKKIFDLAGSVFSDYTDEQLKKYLDTFTRRFFSQQFKRSCLPDGPRVTEISLSPRGSWQMPSDVSGALWRENINESN